MAKTLIGQMSPRNKARMYSTVRYFEVGLERKAGKDIHTIFPYSVQVRPSGTRWAVLFGALGTTSQAWFDPINTKEEAIIFAKCVRDAAEEYFSRRLKLSPDKLGNLIAKDVVV